MTETLSICFDWLQNHPVITLIITMTSQQFQLSSYFLAKLHHALILLSLWSDLHDAMQWHGTDRWFQKVWSRLQKFFNNYSSGQKLNKFTQSSRVITTYHDLCPVENQKTADLNSPQILMHQIKLLSLWEEIPLTYFKWTDVINICIWRGRTNWDRKNPHMVPFNIRILLNVCK